MNKTQPLGYDQTMPKVFSKNGFNFVIYTQDHHPPHVHVFHGEYEVVLGLGASPKAIYIYQARNMSM
ncbi:MAG: DUF4160 domain-containing protein [Candidatus Sericytochromatia bacterium]|nr:DUF4160 domain-containing protein [Candidatus Sericytochromatia bacterium]